MTTLRYRGIPQAKRLTVWVRDNGCCHYCHRILGETGTVDHVWPRAFGGSDRLENLVACCQDCNLRFDTQVDKCDCTFCALAMTVHERPHPEAVVRRLAIQRWHERNHYYGYGSAVPVDLCWFCQRNVVICRHKVSYPSVRVAAEAAMALNIERSWEYPVAPYGCHYCGDWHLTSKLDKRRQKRVEKQRRRHLTRSATRKCAYDPPCPNPVLDIMVPLNPRMPDRPACKEHAMPQVEPTIRHKSDNIQ